MQRAIVWYSDDSALGDSETSQDGTEKTKEAKQAVQTFGRRFRAAAQLGKDKFKEQPHADFLSISDSVGDLDAETREVNSCRKAIRGKMLQRMVRP